MIKNALFFCLLSNFLISPVFAETGEILPFDKGSYQALLNTHKDKPIVLVLWSITCSSCMKEMKSLKKISDQHPEVTFVTISVDDFSSVDQVKNILENNQLSPLDNWLFTENNSAKLRYQIDPLWYGELPRTYFLDAQHNRAGFSGILSEHDYDRIIATITP